MLAIYPDILGKLGGAKWDFPKSQQFGCLTLYRLIIPQTNFNYISLLIMHLWCFVEVYRGSQEHFDQMFLWINTPKQSGTPGSKSCITSIILEDERSPPSIKASNQSELTCFDLKPWKGVTHIFKLVAMKSLLPGSTNSMYSISEKLANPPPKSWRE